MRHFGFALALALAVLTAGCAQPKPKVSVDFAKLPKPKVPAVSVTVAANTWPKPETIVARSLEGIPPITVSLDRAEDRAALRAKLESESRRAIELLSSRLNQFYQRDYDVFYRLEFEKMTPLYEKLTAASKSKIRGIFERYAILREPVLVRLSVLAGFPPPETVITSDEKTTGPAILKRQNEIRDLQRRLLELDQAYDREIVTLDDELRTSLGDETEKFIRRLDERQLELSRRALTEATAQIRKANSAIGDRVLTGIELALPAVSAKKSAATQVSSPPSGFIAAKPPEPAARIQSSVDEVRIWAEVQGFELVPSSPGTKDGTRDFLEWRRRYLPGR